MILPTQRHSTFEQLAREGNDDDLQSGTAPSLATRYIFAESLAQDSQVHTAAKRKWRHNPRGEKSTEAYGQAELSEESSTLVEPPALTTEVDTSNSILDGAVPGAFAAGQATECKTSLPSPPISVDIPRTLEETFANSVPPSTFDLTSAQPSPPPSPICHTTSCPQPHSADTNGDTIVIARATASYAFVRAPTSSTTTAGKARIVPTKKCPLLNVILRPVKKNISSLRPRKQLPPLLDKRLPFGLSLKHLEQTQEALQARTPQNTIDLPQLNPTAASNVRPKALPLASGCDTDVDEFSSGSWSEGDDLYDQDIPTLARTKVLQAAHRIA